MFVGKSEFKINNIHTDLFEEASNDYLTNEKKTRNIIQKVFVLTILHDQFYKKDHLIAHRE